MNAIPKLVYPARGLPRAPLASMLLLWLVNCGPDQVQVDVKADSTRFAESVCGARQRCGCSDPRFSSTEQCETELKAAFEATLATEGLSLDTDCFQSILANEVVSGCPSVPWSPWHGCPAIVGRKAEGEHCETYHELMPFPVNDCKEGLLCFGGFCEQETYSMELEPGDFCQREFGCFSQYLYCGADSRCHPIVAPGEACDDYQACSLNHYCEGLGDGLPAICAPKVALGEPCGSGKDWGPCLGQQDGNVWCNPETGTCEVGQPTICSVTHPVVLSDG
jgi:hypothetical protein